MQYLGFESLYVALSPPPPRASRCLSSVWLWLSFSATSEMQLPVQCSTSTHPPSSSSSSVGVSRYFCGSHLERKKRKNISLSLGYWQHFHHPGQCIVYPLALLPNTNALRFTSILSISLVFFVVICVIQDSIRYMFDSGGSQDMFKKSRYLSEAAHTLPLACLWHFRSGRPWAGLPVQALHEHLPVSAHRHFLLPGFVGWRHLCYPWSKAIPDTPRPYYSLPHLPWAAQPSPCQNEDRSTEILWQRVLNGKSLFVIWDPGYSSLPFINFALFTPGWIQNVELIFDSLSSMFSLVSSATFVFGVIFRWVVATNLCFQLHHTCSSYLYLWIVHWPIVLNLHYFPSCQGNALNAYTDDDEDRWMSMRCTQCSLIFESANFDQNIIWGNW